MAKQVIGLRLEEDQILRVERVMVVLQKEHDREQRGGVLTQSDVLREIVRFGLDAIEKKYSSNGSAKPKRPSAA